MSREKGRQVIVGAVLFVRTAKECDFDAHAMAAKLEVPLAYVRSRAQGLQRRGVKLPPLGETRASIDELNSILDDSTKRAGGNQPPIEGNGG